MIQLTKEEFNSLLEFTSKDKLKYTLGGFYCDPENKLVAIDGRRLIVIHDKITPDNLKGKIISIAMLRKAKKNETVYITEEDEIHYCSKQNVQLKVKIEFLDGKFPNWRLFMSTDKTKVVYNASISHSLFPKEYEAYKMYFTKSNTAQVFCKLVDDYNTIVEGIDVVIMPKKTEDNIYQNTAELAQEKINEIIRDISDVSILEKLEDVSELLEGKSLEDIIKENNKLIKQGII